MSDSDFAGWNNPCVPPQADAQSQATQTAAEEAEVRERFRYWQNRIMIAAIVGYTLFYFVRKNLSLAMPAIEVDLGITKKDLGWCLTLHGLAYGFSKFFNGLVSDRSDARWFMVTGLVLSALMSVAFGFSVPVAGLCGVSVVAVFSISWVLNGWFQGMGFPPSARLMTHWFSPKELATKMSLWNSSHSIGAGLVAILCGYLVVYNWRLCFWVPAGIALLGSIYLAITLRDTPESLGLPEVEGTATAKPTDADSNADSNADSDPNVTPPEESYLRVLVKYVTPPKGSYLHVLVKYVFANPWIWMISFANFFVYILRHGILDWGPTFLKETRHIELSHAGWVLAAFELAGIAGMLSSGWITDKVFGGRGTRTCLVYMSLCTVTFFVFWKMPVQSVIANTVLLAVAGFFIYGPQCLIGIIAANMATKKAAGTAGGLTGIFGYLSTIPSGLGIGYLVDHYHNWDVVFLIFTVAGVLGSILFALCWPAHAHGYDR